MQVVDWKQHLEVCHSLQKCSTRNHQHEQHKSRPSTTSSFFFPGGFLFWFDLLTFQKITDRQPSKIWKVWRLKEGGPKNQPTQTKYWGQFRVLRCRWSIDRPLWCVFGCRVRVPQWWGPACDFVVRKLRRLDFWMKLIHSNSKSKRSDPKWPFSSLVGGNLHFERFSWLRQKGRKELPGVWHWL